MLATELTRIVCPKELVVKKKENRFEVLSDALKVAIQYIGKGMSVEDAVTRVSVILEDGYKTDMFSFAWMLEYQVRDDLQKIHRALSYIFSEGEVILETDVWCNVSTPYLADGLVSAKADIVLKRKNGNVVAVILNLGKCHRGPKGKTLKTQAKGDPQAVVVKAALEEKYPGIIIWNVYLQHPADKPGNIAGSFFAGNSADSQIQILTYKEYEESGVFDRESFLRFAKEAFNNAGDPPCMLCPNAYQCKNGTPKLEPIYDAVIEQEKPYVLPTFSKEQEQIIAHEDGAFLVVAGPGSGKTATLVGRLKYLVEVKAVPPEFILAITFTNKAAGEIKKRCASFLKEGDEINIFTLNALGYGILRDNADALNQEVNLLTPSENLTLIDSLLDELAQPLKGFSYELKDGSNGLLCTVQRRLAEYHKNPKCFLEKHKEHGEDFTNFAQNYFDILEHGNYIDFSGQITKCLELLKNNPDLCRDYQQQFWYVCVDEYQDIDKDQCELIDLLAAGHGNLMAIGDDDQSIYEFRGGSPMFMFDFPSRYPQSQIFFLSRNYRSSNSIVQIAAQNIGASSLNRFEKQIVSVKDGGEEPVIMEGSNLASMAAWSIRDCIRKGVDPEDIAVLSWSNSVLEEVCKENPKLPLHLEKEYLCRSAFFTFVKDVLHLYLCRANLEEAGEALSEYFSLFSIKCPPLSVFREKYLHTSWDYPYVEQGNEDCAYKCLKHCFVFLDKCREKNIVMQLLEKAADITGYIVQPVYSQMVELFSRKRLKTICDLQAEMERMVSLNDDMRLEAVHPGKVLLTTVHESKGREWKAVILLDDFGEKETPTVRRLIFVGLTRAEEYLYICKKPGKSLLVS